jgi:hypothetical protein
LVILDDLRSLTFYLLEKQSHSSLIATLDSHRFSHKSALTYLKDNPVLSGLYDTCQTTQQLGIDPVIYVNSLDYAKKNAVP